MRRTTLTACVAVLLALYVQKSDQYTAMGNLGTVINGEELFTTDLDPDRPATKSLECYVYENDDRLSRNLITPTWGQFYRISDKKQFPADIGLKKMAELHFGQAKAENAGAYRCEMKINGELVTGMMFAYTHPIFKNNESWPLTKSKDVPFTAVGPEVYAGLETTARISCPVIAYPEPQINWFKDNFPLELSDRVLFNKRSGVLSIVGVKEEDTGIYRCEATNQFPMSVRTPEQEFVSKLEQKLVIGDNYGWMLPLAIILIILLLLFLIIFTCQRCTKYKADQYNVADRERALHNDQVPLKNSV